MWWDMPNFVRLFIGGYGSGKTIQLCKRHIELALGNGPIPTAIVSPTYAMAKETVVATISELLEGQSVIQKAWGGDLRYEERKSTPFEFKIWHRARLPDGRACRPRQGRIIVYSGEDPKKLKGTNLSSAGIDEPFIQEFEVFEQMAMRVRHPKAKRLELNLTGTPEQLNWGYDLAEGELRERYDVGIVQASTLENKALSEAYLQRLIDALDPKAAMAYIHGMFVNMAKGLVLYAFDRMENVVDLEMPSHAELGCGMDFNVNPMAAAVFWVTMRGETVDHIHFFDEIELPNSDTQDMCLLLNERYREPGLVQLVCRKDTYMRVRSGLREIYPDASGRNRSTSAPAGKTDYDYIEQAGFNANARFSGNPARRDRFNAANNRLRAVGGRVRMTVSPHCKKLIKYMQTYAHEFLHLENQKAMSHLIDAATYPVAYLCPSDHATLKKLRMRGA